MSVNSASALLAILTELSMRIALQCMKKELGAGMAVVADIMEGEAKAESNGVTVEERFARKEGFRFVIWCCGDAGGWEAVLGL